MIDYKDIEPRLAGMWEEIFAAYGIDLPKWQGKNTKNAPCPLCGGDDRAHFRMTEGRVSLFCRHCAADRMKSAEEVLMEYSGMEFHDMVRELAQFAGHVDNVQITKAKKRVAATPKRNIPISHCQVMPEQVEVALSKCELVANHWLLNRFSLQYPYDLHATKKGILLPIQNESGVFINSVMIKTNEHNKVEKLYQAGGISYGAWHQIPRCETRQPDGVVWCVSLVEGLRQWWTHGKETRVLFDINNMIYAVNVGIAKPADEIICSDIERELLPVMDSLTCNRTEVQ